MLNKIVSFLLRTFPVLLLSAVCIVLAVNEILPRPWFDAGIVPRIVIPLSSFYLTIHLLGVDLGRVLRYSAFAYLVVAITSIALPLLEAGAAAWNAYHVVVAVFNAFVLAAALVVCVRTLRGTGRPDSGSQG